jgi:hypothetical protein
MNQPHSTSFSQAARQNSQHVSLRQDAPDKHALSPAELPMRNYRISYLDSDRRLCDTSRTARAHPAYEQAFCVLKQGALVNSAQGIMAVEDVLPGDKLRLGNGTYETVEWRGSITMQPDAPTTSDPQPALTRITADAMGYNRPSPDLVLGYGARILHRAAGIRRVSGSDAAFIPAADFIDGNNVLSLRPTARFAFYQFGFSKQQSLEVNGVEVETLHPGTAFNLGLRGAALRAYLALFPHKQSFEDFGLLECPRLRLRDLELLD